ncbi:MAG: hypothetical protein KKF85_02720 [Gammaproteobacteria bacterium]|nr:hypothetical protein [Rhodocyclaceae bacterium]MBU3908740.1 hypothetical protein [Gammaproteobacteria bacterium]MBU4004768.1 hypothetical protein [Gammaproteobacteria bacterium]MBU4021371.1 hypothetical protein [Gammaproteobacteria bacterium]MBU4096388.1 hypothetical protein [Gammaproteobacteria bacterium]
MNTPAAQQRIPPKLRQLLESMPDVDKVKLMQIAHHYSMDLDDPGFLPLLLTQQGISALEKARAEMVSEVDAALNRVAAKIVEASSGEAERLKEYSASLAGHLKQQTEEAEAKIKNAVGTWAAGPLVDAVFSAVVEQIEATAAVATKAAAASADAASAKFSQNCEAAVLSARTAAGCAEAAAAEASAVMDRAGAGWMTALFLGGALTGALLLAIVQRYL